MNHRGLRMPARSRALAALIGLVAVMSAIIPAARSSAVEATPTMLTVTVTDQAGAPVVAAWVNADGDDGQIVPGELTDTAGVVTLTLPALGGYTLRAWPTTAHAPLEQPLTADGPAQSVTLVLAPASRISGTIDLRGAPVESVGVAVFRQTADGWQVTGSPSPRGSSFSFDRLAAGTYRIVLDAVVSTSPYLAYPKQYWGGSTSFTTAQTLTLGVGETRSDIRLALVDAGSTVTTVLTTIPAAGAGGYLITAERSGEDPNDVVTQFATVQSAPTSATLMYRLATGSWRISYQRMAEGEPIGELLYWTGDGRAVTADASKAVPLVVSSTAARTISFGTDPSQAGAGIQSGRISGEDRYATAVALSQAGYPERATTVYLATGTNYPDALSAAPAAVAEGGPLLLTPPDALPSSVIAELDRLRPSKIVVVGGTGAIGAPVFAQLQPFAPTVVRVAGDDRFSTSRKIVEQAFASAPAAYVATGLNYPDALSASAAAASKGRPVLLVNGGARSVDRATTALIEALGTTTFSIAGGVGAVSSGIERDLKSSGTVVRLAGEDRFATSQRINAAAFPNAREAYFATGFQFPDALAGAVLAGVRGAPLYVVQASCVPSAVVDDLIRAKASSITLIGGERALGRGVAALTRC